MIGFLLILISCQKNDKINGIWTRQGDRLMGMKIEIIKKGDVSNGIIIYIPDSIKMSGFEVNDIKWKGIKHIEDNYYEFEDLGKETDYFGKITKVRYDLTRLIVSNDTIRIRGYTKGEEIVGTEQIWVKSK